MARSWKEVRPQVVTDETRVAAHRDKLDAEVRAYRLAEIRKEQALTQVEVAELIGVTQPNVSRLEKGELESTAIATVRAYVEALGGKLSLIADFGDRKLVIQ